MTTNTSHTQMTQRRWLPPTLLIVAAVIAFADSFHGAFLFDDVYRIIDNERIRYLWPPWPLFAVERPVVEITLALNYALGRLDPWGYHALNLVIHILAGLVLFGIVRRTFTSIASPAPEMEGARVAGIESESRGRFARSTISIRPTTFSSRATWTAFAIALLFLVHPLQTQSVTYIIQRGESLMGLFFLLTLYCFVRGIDSPRTWLWAIASIAACALGMATKAVMVVAPVIVLIYDWVFVSGRDAHDRITSVTEFQSLQMRPGSDTVSNPGTVDEEHSTASSRSRRQERKRRAIEHAGARDRTEGRIDGDEGSRGLKPAARCGFLRRWWWHAGLFATWGVLWICGIAREVLGWSSGPSHVGFSYHGVSPWTYAATQPGVIVKYLQLSYWPASLCLDYDWLPATTWERIVAPTVVIVILMAATIHQLFRRSWIGFVGAWFFVILAPTSSFVPIKDMIFEHRMYLPLIAVITITVIVLRTALHELCDRARLSVFTRRAIAAVLVLNAAASLTYGTLKRNRDYASDLVMWEDVVAKRPNNARAHVAVGNALAARDRIDEAVEVTRQATLLDQEFADARCALGVVLVRQGKLDEAIEAYREALRLDPRHSKAWYNLGNALDRREKYEEAVDAYRKSIDAYSKFPDAHCNLGNSLVRLGRIDDGVQAFRETLAIDPDHVKGHNNLGDALNRLGRLDEAATEFETAIRLQSDYARARINLAHVRMVQRRYAEAIEQCEAVLAGDPDNSTALDLLARAKAASGS